MAVTVLKKTGFFSWLFIWTILFYTQLASAANDGRINNAIKEALDHGEIQKVISLAEPMAIAGDVSYQEFLCLLYWHGIGIEENSQAALNWCSKSMNIDVQDIKQLLKIKGLGGVMQLLRIENLGGIKQILSKIIFLNNSTTPLKKTQALAHLIAKAESGDSEAQWLLYNLHTLELVYLPEGLDSFFTTKWPKSMRENFLMSRKEWIKSKEEHREGKRKWIKLAAENNHPEALLVYVSEWMKDDTSEEKRRFLKLMISVAERGETKPLISYALRLEDKTPKLFVKYMTLAADQGDARAMVYMGNFYIYDDKVQNVDYRKATKWYRMAVKEDGTDSGNILTYAKLLKNPLNPANDFNESVRWLSIAANMAHENSMGAEDVAAIYEAQFLLAEIYQTGDEVPRNSKLAASLYQRLAELNVYYAKDDPGYTSTAGFDAFVAPYEADYFSMAQFNLGRMYEVGDGIARDEEQALYWYSKVKKHGHPLAAKYAKYLKQYLASKMSAVSPFIITSIQNDLQNLGFRIGKSDGVIGKKTYNAIRAFQCMAAVPIDGQPSETLIENLKSWQNRLSRNTSDEALNKQLLKNIRKVDIDCITASLVKGANPNAMTAPPFPVSIIEEVAAVSIYSYDLGDDANSNLINVQILKAKHVEIVKAKSVEIVKILIEYGANTSGKALPSSAISEGNVELVQLLLRNGASPAKKTRGKKPIVLAAYYDQDDVAKVLIEYGEVALSKEKKALERISRIANSFTYIDSDYQIVKQALSDGADINGVSSNGKTILFDMVSSSLWDQNSYRMLEFLLKNDADPNVQSENPHNYHHYNTNLTLHVFIDVNYKRMNAEKEHPIYKKKWAIDAMHLLIKHGAKIAARDENGMTPLHWAAKSDNYEAAKILLNAGALVSHRDNKINTPLDYAESAKMISLLSNKSGISSVADSPSKPQFQSGTGFFITKLGHILTNAHVVERCDNLQVGNSRGQKASAKIIISDKKNDLALIKVASSASTGTGDRIDQTMVVGIIPSKPLGQIRSQDVKLGEPVIVSGFPYADLISRSVKITSGIVSSTRGIGDDTGQFQLDAAVQAGNSGGPIYDDGGNIIGVVVAQISKLKMAKAIGSLPENSNFGIKSSTVRTFLDSSELRVEVVDRGEKVSMEKVAEIAENQTVMIKCLN